MLLGPGEIKKFWPVQISTTCQRGAPLSFVLVGLAVPPRVCLPSLWTKVDTDYCFGDMRLSFRNWHEVMYQN
jgi:hypothetical protein